MLTNNSQRGFYLIEAIVVMSVAISLMSLGSRYITDSAERSVNQVTAQQLKQVTRAAQQYVQDHYQAFNDNPNHPLEWQTLVDQGYLSDKVLNHNHYGQDYHFEVKNANGQLQLILTTREGQPISESSMRQIAAIAGSSAGYATTFHNNKVVGNQEGWFLDGVPLVTGHLASLSIINEKEIMDAANFLRRTKFKDHEAYNRMETDLLMGENTVHWVKNNNVVKLNTDELVFRDAKGKSIGIFNSPLYPHVTIKDSTLPDAPNDMLLNSDNLYFEKGDNYIHINVDKPKITIKKTNHEIEISDNKIFIYKNPESFKYSSVLDKGITRPRAVLEGSGIKLPYFIIRDDYDAEGFRKYLCGSMEGYFNDEDGKMFLLGMRKTGSNLYICLAGIPRRIALN